MDVILIPGMWLDASAWDTVVPGLERAGHRAHALTLPGMESKDANRSQVTLQDHIDAVVLAIDAIDSADSKVVLVGHSMGGFIAYAAADARIDRIARIIYVGSEPGVDGGSGGWPGEIDNGEIPLPEWSWFDDEMVADLDDQQRADFRTRSIPWPARVSTDTLHLGDERRWDVPATLITCEYSSAQLKEWTDQGAPGTEEIARLRDLEYVDLGSGHWPQFTRSDDLTRSLIASIR